MDRKDFLRIGTAGGIGARFSSRAAKENESSIMQQTLKIMVVKVYACK